MLLYSHGHLERVLERINREEGGLDAFSLSYRRRGVTVEEGGIWCREWAPAAVEAHLFGDFNGWNRLSHPMTKNEWGLWEVFLPDAAPAAGSMRGAPAISHGDRVKMTMRGASGEHFDRIPAWIRYALQDASTGLFEGVFWNPPVPHAWTHRTVVPRAEAGEEDALRIYESHVGICTAEGKVASYREYADGVLPRVHALGYNTVQLMAVMEHAYYGSFGYQVTSFFAPSSRFGTPDDLKYLVDKAHGLGIRVLLDIVHSHACKNTLDGLNCFDGSDAAYFHEGSRGRHALWDSRLFDYSQMEVLRFLLSNLRYWIDEFAFDGFRFDGVTSMLYHHHGIGYGFSGDYHEYFQGTVDGDALAYLQLANALIHALDDGAGGRRAIVSIGEDVSGMPLLCRPVAEGGVGFDYRLAMAIPDMWIKLLKEVKDEDWQVGFIVHTLTNRRYMERTIAYAESHDQALVGDKTLAFWLMDKEMYDHMSLLGGSPTPIIDRGMALHKLIRLITFALGGEAYLAFMGNEFGHPEWLDFPRRDNGWSYAHCRRQYNLVDDPNLRYGLLAAFDRVMMALDGREGLLLSPQAYVTLTHEVDKVIVFERAGLVWIFNFHPTKSFAEYRVGVHERGTYRIILNSDAPCFGGHGRVIEALSTYETGGPWCGRAHSLSVYIPSRCALVLKRASPTLPDPLLHAPSQ